MIDYDVTKISSSTPMPSTPITATTATTASSFLNPATWSYKTKIYVLTIVAIIVLILFLRVRLFGKSNLSNNINQINSE